MDNPNRTASKIGFATAFGAVIGALLAKDMHLFWPLGVAVGAVVSYLSYEWRSVARAISPAYRAAGGLVPSRLGLMQFGWAMAAYASALSLIAGLTVAAVQLAVLTSSVFIAIIGFALFLIGAGAAGCGLLVAVGITLFAYDHELERYRLIRESKEICFQFFPPIVLFWHLPRGIAWLARNMPMIVRAIGRSIGRGSLVFARFLRRFVFQVFIRIHSEERTICLTDSAIAATVAHFTAHGNAALTVSAAVGGFLLGFVNYRVVTLQILVPRGLVVLRS